MKMAVLSIEDIIEGTGGKLLSENSRTFTGVSIDSRTIGSGEIFFALKGERFDGHAFLEDALEKGSGAVVESSPVTIPEKKVVIYVGDSLRSLQDLARFLRKRRDIPVVAVTGSNGKTTTKEMAHAILSRKFRTLKNEGNLNNHIGLPLSLMKMTPDDELIVLEMGMNALGEIRKLCEIAIPSHGVITNIGSAHLGRLGSLEAVRAAKLEVLDAINVAVVNGDDSFLMEGVKGIKEFNGRIITFAVHNDADVKASYIKTTEGGSSFILNIRDEGSIPVSLGVHGYFNIYNALAAAAVSYSLGIPPEEIKTALESFRSFSMRFEVTKKGSVTLINDAYNANPSSMKESLKELIRLSEGKRSVAVLGDMFELEGFGESAHREIGKEICQVGVDVFVAVGEMMHAAAEECVKAKDRGFTPEVHIFKKSDEARENIMEIITSGDTVLIKGSRTMLMEKVAGGISDVI
jgi:UDP-N-acetylmuramoyl-tripeptide--D-alanyl-D-alanine ligase